MIIHMGKICRIYWDLSEERRPKRPDQLWGPTQPPI